MKEEQIKDILLKHKIDYTKNSTIWGPIIPSISAYENGLGEVMHVMKDHILHFNSKGIAIIAVDDMLGIPREKQLVFINKSDIHGIKIRMRRTKFILSIQTNRGLIEYKIRKSILGAPWHKENLSYLLLQTV